MTGSSDAPEIVHSAAEAAEANLAPLLILDPLEAFFDEAGLGSGPLEVEARIGDGRSNVTYLMKRRSERFVLRRPPRPPFPPHTQEVVREARIQLALEPVGVPVPHVRAIAEDEAILGVPFYVMSYVDGVVCVRDLPAALDTPAEHRAIGFELIEALAGIHAVDLVQTGLAEFGRPDGYLERQIRRFRGLAEVNATRELPLVEEVGAWLDANRPASPATTVVHGDYRLGNVMLTRDPPTRILAILDWEMATIGDPLADLGFLIAYMCSGSREIGLDAFDLPAGRSFPERAELVGRYTALTGRPVDGIDWYETLALWKSAILIQGIHYRRLHGQLPTTPEADSLEGQVERLLEAAADTAAQR